MVLILSPIHPPDFVTNASEEFRNALLELSVSFEKFLRFFGAYIEKEFCLIQFAS